MIAEATAPASTPPVNITSDFLFIDCRYLYGVVIIRFRIAPAIPSRGGTAWGADTNQSGLRLIGVDIQHLAVTGVHLDFEDLFRGRHDVEGIHQIAVLDLQFALDRRARRRRLRRL